MDEEKRKLKTMMLESLEFTTRMDIVPVRR
jgi:hypothetical protein